MGDMSISKWCLKMEEHKRRGKRIIKYVDLIDNDLIEKKAEIKNSLLIKQQKMDFWEKNHRLPTEIELDLQMDRLGIRNYWIDL